MSNSFPTEDGTHVTGAVAMALNDKGTAVPVDEDTPIGAVTVRNQPFTLDQFCRALAFHASIVKGGDPETIAKDMIAFARKEAP